MGDQWGIMGAQWGSEFLKECLHGQWGIMHGGPMDWMRDGVMYLVERMFAHLETTGKPTGTPTTGRQYTGKQPVKGCQ